MTPIYKLSANSVKNGRTVYGSMLAGNPAFRPSSFESIATATPSSGATSVTFSSIPSTYNNLQIRGIIKRNATNSINLGWRFNSDTTTSYVRHFLTGNGSATAAGSVLAYSSAIDAQMAGSVANLYGAFVTDIHDYTSGTKNKTIRTFAGFDTNGAGTVTLNSNLWINTSAITSITLYFQGDALGAGCVFSLYGIKGA